MKLIVHCMYFSAVAILATVNVVVVVAQQQARTLTNVDFLGLGYDAYLGNPTPIYATLASSIPSSLFATRRTRQRRMVDGRFQTRRSPSRRSAVPIILIQPRCMARRPTVKPCRSTPPYRVEVGAPGLAPARRSTRYATERPLTGRRSSTRSLDACCIG